MTMSPCRGGASPARATKSNSPDHLISFCFFFTVLTSFIPTRTTAQTLPPPPRTAYYLHGRIYTNDPQHPWASAMAVREGKIVCVGGIEQIMLECGGGEENA